MAHAPLTAAARRCRYDLVVATGDYADSQRGWATAIRAFRALPPGLGVFAVIGGHERYPAPGLRDGLRLARGLTGRRPRRWIDPAPFVAALEAAGVRVLINASCTLAIGGARVRFVGLDDAYLGLDDLPAALPPPGAPPAFPILLSHSPDGVRPPATARFPLAFAGHTHGGQIRLPGFGAPLRHTRSLGRRQAAGLLRRGATQLVVSRGFGTTTLPLRFACRPELGVVELRQHDPARGDAAKSSARTHAPARGQASTAEPADRSAS